MANPALDTQTTAGLFVSGKEVPIPLEGVSVEATIKDFCTRVGNDTRELGACPWSAWKARGGVIRRSTEDY
jgi:hypothetical protein